MKEKLFDQRIVERNIKRGIVSREQYQEYINSLEDCSDLAADMETKFLRKVQAEQESQKEDRARKQWSILVLPIKQQNNLPWLVLFGLLEAIRYSVKAGFRKQHYEC